MKDDLANLSKWAIRMAGDANKIISEYFSRQDKGVEIKSDNTPVTQADKGINRLLIDRVQKDFPGHGVLGEEMSSHSDRNELWVCDPIDGTQSFIEGIPTALFSLAFVVNGEPKVAVIGDPFQRVVFSAIKGMGAFCNGKKITVSKQDKFGECSLTFSSNYIQLKKHRVFYDELVSKIGKQVLVSGNVFKSSLIANGYIDGYIFPGRSAHDIAAAKLIVEEAGGKVTDLYGNEQRYDKPIFGAIVSNGLIHNELVNLLADFGPENFIGY